MARVELRFNRTFSQMVRLSRRYFCVFTLVLLLSCRPNTRSRYGVLVFGELIDIRVFGNDNARIAFWGIIVGQLGTG